MLHWMIVENLVGYCIAIEGKTGPWPCTNVIRKTINIRLLCSFDEAIFVGLLSGLNRRSNDFRLEDFSFFSKTWIWFSKSDRITLASNNVAQLS